MGRADEIGELGRSFDRMTEVLSNQMLGAVAALVSAIDARDQYTRGHSLRVGHLAALIGSSLGLSQEHRHFLQVGGYLHDIGKIGVRDAVLLKPGRLEPGERESIQAHPAIGREILGSVGLPDAVIAGVVGHHERLDGSGYPLGLRGDELSIFPRIISVADIYDALITDRPYRAGMPLADVLAELRLEVERGHLDREVVATAHLVAPEWERLWRNDSRMSGFTLVDASLDHRLFDRAPTERDRAQADLTGVAR
jgi:putative nucleotidyltransferase with HDIG domain